MKQNGIKNNEVLIFDGHITRNPARSGTHLVILIMDEYVKSKNYQKLIRDNNRLCVGGNLLYSLLTELFEYVTRLFGRIRLEDLNLNEGNKTLLFLKKFSSSSEHIKIKIDKLNTLKQPSEPELFILHISGQENSVSFARNQDGNSRLSLEIPVSFLFNRLISYVDSMDFTDLNSLDSGTRKKFMDQFNDLNLRILDQKKQIDMKYALELSQERARDLETQNAALTEKITQINFQRELYKRSYFNIRKELTDLKRSAGMGGDDTEALEEL
ncbi:MAG: hypothetical protein PQJ58_20120 [Spirochaetales bacterium]|nr:hypothetical protein [Spirochaetales bacterium]